MNYNPHNDEMNQIQHISNNKSIIRRLTDFGNDILHWGIFYPYRNILLNGQDDIKIHKFCTILAAIFCGSLGAHKFMLGRPKMGLIYLLLSWTFIPGLLGIFEGIGYLLMTDESFYQKYYLDKLGVDH